MKVHKFCQRKDNFLSEMQRIISEKFAFDDHNVFAKTFQICNPFFFFFFAGKNYCKVAKLDGIGSVARLLFRQKFFSRFWKGLTIHQKSNFQFYFLNLNLPNIFWNIFFFFFFYVGPIRSSFFLSTFLNRTYIFLYNPQ